MDYKKFFKNIIYEDSWTAVPVLLTPPVRAKPDSGTEIRTLLGASGVLLYLVTIKSFLRHCSNVSVFVHEDGTFSNWQRNILRHHVKGIRIIESKDADKAVKPVLEKYPYCRKFRASRINLRQVFDFSIMSRADKMIMLDSDVLFFKPPEEVIEWIASDSEDILYSFEHNPCMPNIGNVMISRLEIPFRLTPNLCCGFVCCHREIFDLELIERYCEFVDKHCDDNITRYYTQGIVSLCAAHSKYNKIALPLTYQIPLNFTEGAVSRHYWASLHKTMRKYLQDARLIIADMLVLYKLTRWRLPVRLWWRICSLKRSFQKAMVSLFRSIKKPTSGNNPPSDCPDPLDTL